MACNNPKSFIELILFQLFYCSASLPIKSSFLGSKHLKKLLPDLTFLAVVNVELSKRFCVWKGTSKSRMRTKIHIFITNFVDPHNNLEHILHLIVNIKHIKNIFWGLWKEFLRESSKTNQKLFSNVYVYNHLCNPCYFHWQILRYKSLFFS